MFQKIKNIALYSSLSMISYNSYSQKVAVPLSFVSGKNENVNSMLLLTRIEQNISNYRGFDTLKYEFWGIMFSSHY